MQTFKKKTKQKTPKLVTSETVWGQNSDANMEYILSIQLVTVNTVAGLCSTLHLRRKKKFVPGSWFATSHVHHKT